MFSIPPCKFSNENNTVQKGYLLNFQVHLLELMTGKTATIISLYGLKIIKKNLLNLMSKFCLSI